MDPQQQQQLLSDHLATQQMAHEMFQFILQFISFADNDVPNQICVVVDKNARSIQPYRMQDMTIKHPGPFVIAKLPLALHNRIAQETGLSTLQIPMPSDGEGGQNNANCSGSRGNGSTAGEEAQQSGDGSAADTPSTTGSSSSNNGDQTMRFSSAPPVVGNALSSSPQRMGMGLDLLMEQKFSPVRGAGSASNSSSTSSTDDRGFSTRRSSNTRKRSSKQLDNNEEDNITRGSWTDEEDARLIELVEEHGPKKWTTIASFLKGRIGKQCRERYLNHLDPNITKNPWTRDEDISIMKLHEEFGNQWAKISRHLPGRTANAVKNRWNSALSKKGDLEYSSGPESSATSSVAGNGEDSSTPQYTIMVHRPPEVDASTTSAVETSHYHDDSINFDYTYMLKSPTSAHTPQMKKRSKSEAESDGDEEAEEQGHSGATSSSTGPQSKRARQLNLEADEPMFNPFQQRYLEKSPMNQPSNNKDAHASSSSSSSSTTEVAVSSSIPGAVQLPPVTITEKSAYRNLSVDVENISPMMTGISSNASTPFSIDSNGLLGVSSSNNFRLLGDTPRTADSNQHTPRLLWNESTPKNK